MFNDNDYFGILVLPFGMLVIAHFFLYWSQWCAESKYALVIKDLQSQIAKGAEDTRRIREEDKAESCRIREEDKAEFHASQVALNNKYNAKINVLEVELASLTKECENLRTGRLTFQHEIDESKLIIETLRGEIKRNSVKYTYTIDTLQQEVESLRKQLSYQKNKHDIEMEEMQIRYEELKKKLSRGKLSGGLVVLQQGGEDDEKMMMLGEAYIREHRRGIQEHTQMDDAAKENTLKVA